MKNLNKKDSETYLRLVKLGDMDMIFDFGRLIGSIEAKKDLIEQMQAEQKL